MDNILNLNLAAYNKTSKFLVSPEMLDRCAAQQL